MNERVAVLWQPVEPCGGRFLPLRDNAKSVRDPAVQGVRSLQHDGMGGIACINNRSL